MSKSISQNESNDDSQIPETSIIDSFEDSASDESISEYSYNKKRKKAKIKKSVGRPEDPVNNELTVKKVSNMAKLHAYYVTNARHELNYVGQNLSESDFLKMMHNYTHSLTSGAAMFEEDIQLYDSEDDFEDDVEDNLEDDSIANDLSEVDSSTLEIENSVNLNLALNNVDQPLILDEVIDHGEKNFDIDALVNQGMQMRNASIDEENCDF
ncbi:7259_t:CDS:2 [Cetraspora pellucida]|uniref:7259_t:CDS:1 n=1 Tax=Cetraspora pellucida TaxID=1433469 RepID=A0ACA9M6V1_9GLOM|nr:7259_t:CDS:2 [Cetraspora pellucida]